MRTLKRVAIATLTPLAAVWIRTVGSFHRAWNHALFNAQSQSCLPSSTVLLGEVELHGSGRVEIGEDVLLYPGVYLETQGHGRIRIGSGAVLSRGVHVVAFDEIDIGDGVMIGEYTSLRDANHQRTTGIPLRFSGHTARAIHIGTEAWIGRGCTVLGGVTIGAFATVGANSVVTHGIGEGETHAGVPARLLSRDSAKTKEVRNVSV